METQSIVIVSAAETAPIVTEAQSPFAALLAPVEAQPIAKPAKAKAEKKASTPKAKAKAQPIANEVKFAIRDGFRPSSGTALFAYTHAWLTLSGVAAGGSIPVATARKIAGDTAVSYHTNKTGCFGRDAQGALILTDAGQAKFGAMRKVGQLEVDAFHAIMRTGKTDGKMVKADYAIQAV